LALPPDATNQAFLREVDEELRRDQLAGFWDRYGRLLIVGIVVALAAFAAYLIWRDQQAKALGREGEQLQAAYDDLAAGRTAAAGPPLAALAKNGSDGNRALALFTEGDVLLQRDDLRGAAAKFAAIAEDDGIAQPFRDLATIRRTGAEFDAIPPQQVVDRLRALAVPGNAYFGSAGEMMAIAYLRQGRRDLAGRMFGQIARADGVPRSIRQRAVQMAGDMGVDAVVQPSGPGTPTTSQDASAR